MADFEIRGTVIEKGTKKPLEHLRVEAWDRDTKYHDMLGSAITDGAGRFRMTFTDMYFGDSRPDRLPDVFYRVFRDDALILSTQDHPTENQPGPIINVTLEVEPIVEPEARADRVNVETAIKAVNFFRTSDFTGVRRETGSQFKLAGGLLGRMVTNGFKQWDFNPITASRVKSSDIVNQDTATAQSALAQQEVEVDSVRAFDPKANRDSARLLTALPTNLQPGEKVVLYEENGKVKYYARVQEPKAASIDQLEVQRLSTELASVKTEVNAVRQLQSEVETLKVTTSQDRDATAADLTRARASADELAELKRTVAALQTDLNQRNQTIANLQTELGAVKASQERIERTDVLQRVTLLERRVGG